MPYSCRFFTSCKLISYTIDNGVAFFRTDCGSTVEGLDTYGVPLFLKTQCSMLTPEVMDHLRTYTGL